MVFRIEPARPAALEPVLPRGKPSLLATAPVPSCACARGITVWEGCDRRPGVPLVRRAGGRAWDVRARDPEPIVDAPGAPGQGASERTSSAPAATIASRAAAPCSGLTGTVRSVSTRA